MINIQLWPVNNLFYYIYVKFKRPHFLQPLARCGEWRKLAGILKVRRDLYFTLKLPFSFFAQLHNYNFQPSLSNRELVALNFSLSSWKYINAPTFRHGWKTFWVFLIKRTPALNRPIWTWSLSKFGRHWKTPSSYFNGDQNPSLSANYLKTTQPLFSIICSL